MTARSSAMTEGEARKLAIAWICGTARRPAEVVAELLRLYGHRATKGAARRRWRWDDAYDLMWPMLLDSPTYAGRIRRAVLAADRRSAVRDVRRVAA